MTSHSSAIDHPFERLAVVGAGNMGSGIAQKMATEGFAVTSLIWTMRRSGEGWASSKKDFDPDGVQRGIFAAPRLPRSWAGFPAPHASRAAAVDLVVEAVFEDLEIKKRVFARLDEACRPRSFLRRIRLRTLSPIRGRHDAAGAGNGAPLFSFIRRRTGW